MTRGRGRGALLPAVALLGGVALLVITIAYADLPSIRALSRQLGAALPLALAPAGVWHVVRTAAWRCCFPPDAQPRFGRLFRVRLAAEAFSFVTVRGVAGEPLKVAFLPEVPAATAAAAVALERVAYVVVTLIVVGLAAAVALATLPLSAGWFRVFRALAVAAAVLMIALAWLVTRPPADPLVAAPTRPERGGRLSRAIGRFAHEVRQRWSELVHGDRRRLATLLALEAGSYALMALEVWVVLWAMDVPISAAGAMAVETLTRVASMLSAFVPGGIGVLEASNVAAAAAVAATGGAAALAIVRRVRGLVWCAAGFAVTPGLRTKTTAAPSGPRPHAASEADSSGRGESPVRTLLVLDDAPAGSVVALSDRLGGLPLGERTVRAAVHGGYRRLVVRSPRRHAEWASYLTRHACAHMEIDPSDGGAFVSVAASIAAGDAPSGATGDTASAHTVDTYQVPTSREALAAAERALRASIIKPTDGTLARFNRRLSIPISVWLIRWTRLSANAMSVLVLLLGLCAGWLFAQGDYVSGVVAASISLLASILDGCDGELARLQYRSSSFGCWLDTLGDYAYYLVTFAGLTIGAVRSSGRDAYWWVGGALLAGTLLTFWLLILLRHRATAGRPEQLHARTKAHFESGAAWKRLLARLSFTATRAAMPYGILAFALAGLLPVVLALATVAAHVYWISLALELRRLLPAGGDPGPGAEAATV